MDKKIKDLAEKNLSRTGEWEIAQVPEPAFALQTKYKSTPVLNLVVHTENLILFSTPILLYLKNLIVPQKLLLKQLNDTV